MTEIPDMVEFLRVQDRLRGRRLLGSRLGDRGVLILNPLPATLREFEEFSHQRARVENDLSELRETASTTRDGHHITLAANLEFADDLPLISKLFLP